MGTHAFLGASQSERWLNCPPSARLCENIPEQTTEYAEEGTLAHEIGELKLRKAFETMPKSTYNTRLAKLKKQSLYNEEMLRHTDTYVDVLKEIAIANQSPKVIIEARLDYDTYAQEGFGTGDCVVICGTTLFVVDLKYGKGIPVEAGNNTQMMLYALGAYGAYNILYDIQNVVMIIVQPRLDSVSRWELPICDLLNWGESIKPIAQQAWEGAGELTAGKHCKWCKIKNTCRTRSAHFLELEDWNMALPPILSNEEVGLILTKSIGLLAWVEELKDYAFNEVSAGRPIEGWKIVEGISKRKISDVDAAFTALIGLDIPKSKLYIETPIAMTAAEKLLSTAQQKEAFEKYLIKPPGKPTLVEVGDKREPLNCVATDFEGVNYVSC